MMISAAESYGNEMKAIAFLGTGTIIKNMLLALVVRKLSEVDKVAGQ